MIEATSEEKAAQSSGTVQHAQRKKQIEVEKKLKLGLKVKKEWLEKQGDKLIRKQLLANGNVRKMFAGTKKSNPDAWKKAK